MFYVAGGEVVTAVAADRAVGIDELAIGAVFHGRGGRDYCICTFERQGSDAATIASDERATAQVR